MGTAEAPQGWRDRLLVWLLGEHTILRFTAWARNEALTVATNAQRLATAKLRFTCLLCGREDGRHHFECEHSHFGPPVRIVPCPECGGEAGVHRRYGCQGAELNRVGRAAREKLHEALEARKKEKEKADEE